MVELATTIWADGPALSPYEPQKPQIRAWGTWIEQIITAFTSSNGRLFTLKSNMDAVLTYDATTMAWVIGDPIAANNGVYQKLGASGTGSWVRRADLPYSFIIASDVGAGTPNAIQATTSISVSASALIWMNIADTNGPGATTVQFNGSGPVYTIKTNSGNDPVAGGLASGTIVLGIATGSTFRLVSDQASTALLAAAEAAADRAEDAADRAESIAEGLDLLPVHPEAFGALHNGSNDKAAIEAAAAFAVANNRPLELTTGRTYTFSTLALGALVGFTVIGEGVLRHDGSATSGDIVSFGQNTKADAIKLSIPGHGNGIYDLRLGNGSRVGYCEIVADTQSQGESLTTTGQDVFIGFHKAVNCDRPLHVDNSAGSALTSGFTLCGADYAGYMRGLRITASTDGYIGPLHMRGRSSNALNESPGYNSILLSSAQRFKFAGGVLEDSGEHTIRIGGNTGPGLVNSQDLLFGDFIIKRCSASPIKINPNYNNRAKRISFGDITVVDGGFTTGSTAKRSDGLRLSHCDDVSIRSARFLVEQLSTSCEVAMRLNNATNIRVGLIDARFPESGQLSFDDTADVDTGQAATQSGPVSGVYVDRWIGVKAVGNYPIGFNMPTQTVSNVRINGIKFDGFTVGFIAFAAGTTVGGFIEFQGAIAGAGALVFSNLPDNDTVRLDLMIDGVRVVGPARQITRMAGTTLVVAGDPFNPADTGTLSAAALDVQTAKGTAGDGNYGAGLALHGPAGGRRRAAIASRQMGANSHNVGISFLTNAGSAGSDALVEVLGLKPGGGIRGGLPTFANNAAAVSGGLAANDWYKTASGEFRIVV